MSSASGFGMTLLLVLYLAWLPRLMADTAPLVMGVFPRKGFVHTLENFTPLAEYLSTELGRKVILQSARNFDSFWQGVEQRRYDLVHFNQYHYLRAKKDFGYEVIAKNEENHRSTMSGALFIRQDSGVKTLSDLRGKKIIFGGGRDAMQSYITPSYLLQQAGLNKDAYVTTFAESPMNALFATYFQQALAAGSADVNLELPMVKSRIDTAQFKILAKSEPLAHLPWAVKHELDATLKARLKILLIHLNESSQGRNVLQRASLTAIVSTEDSDYDPHRRIIKQVLGEDY